MEGEDITAKARSLRAQLDRLLERFRGDTIIIEGDGALALVEEVRVVITEEFFDVVSQCSEEVFEKAVLMTYDDSKRLPIHLACDKNAPISILQRLLEADRNKTSIREADKWGDLPLHTACSRHQTEVVKLLVDSDISKKTLYTKADNGSLPIHAAVRYAAPASVVMLLLENSEARSTLFETDMYGQTPLHASCRRGAVPDVINLLLKYDEDKTTVSREDNVGRLPIHLALLHSTENQLEVIRLLLEGMLCNRMESKGLDLWKVDMNNLLRSMQTHERDFTTRDKLDMICDTISEFKERVFVLELAVWRASILQFNARFTSIQDVLDHESSITVGPDFDANAYKVDRRIRSGADVIVRDVIPFLEHEPIDELIQKLKDY